MKQLLLAIQFLTIIPVRVKGEVSEKDMVDSTMFFPVAGACQGLIMASVAAVSIRLFSSEVVCGLVMLAHIISNGGFDLDGLADTADAISVKSSGDREIDIQKRLSVMKDSTIGASGAVAIMMSLLLKFLLLSSLIKAVPESFFLAAVFLMAVFSKWVTVPAMLHGSSARRDGLGRIFIDNIKAVHVILSSLMLFVPGIICLWMVYGLSQLAGNISILAVLIITLYAFSLSALGLFKSRFGGITGDHLGAMSEISELLVLMAIYIWSQHSI